MPVQGLPEVTSIQVYAGTPAPFNFNGLVRHYYSRESSELGELQIILAPRASGRRSSHEVALDLRSRLKSMALPDGAKRLHGEKWWKMPINSDHQKMVPLSEELCDEDWTFHSSPHRS